MKNDELSEALFQVDKTTYKMKTGRNLEGVVGCYALPAIALGFAVGAAAGGLITDETMHWLGPNAPTVVRYAVDAAAALYSGIKVGKIAAGIGGRLAASHVKRVLDAR